MKIKEVEEKLDISSYTLRYYEKMGLIKPYRDENGYRNYSDNDIKILKKIRFLRELEIPIEDIQSIIEGKTTFQNVLDNHMKKIDIQMKSLQYVKETCEDLKEKDIPLLEAMTDERIINDEKISQENVKSNMKKIFDYLKPMKTVVIGNRIDIKDCIGLLFIILLFSVIVVLMMLGIVVPYMTRYINRSFENSSHHFLLPVYEPSSALYIIIIVILFIALLLWAMWYSTEQDYIELLDNHISICSYKLQSRFSIFKSMITKKTDLHNKRYQWSELDYVEIRLYFENKSAGRAGLCTIYVLQIVFNFKDSFQYNIFLGSSLKEDIKTAYQILRNKNIEIIADDIIIDYFEQNELKMYDYFEKIYHKNSKKE